MSTLAPARFAQRAARTVAAGLLTVAVAATPALAQRTAGFASTVRPSVSSMDAIGRSLDRGFRFAGQGRYAEARQEFRAAADRQQRAGHLPETSLWQVAATYYAQQDFRGAAQTLDELATVAGQHGDRQVQGKALLEAAFLYRRAGEVDRSKAIVRELKSLGRAEGMSQGLRDEIARRVGA